MAEANSRDFCYMWQGKYQGPLLPQDIERVSPVCITRTGNHRALLMLHGFSSTPAAYRLIIPQLTEFDAIYCPALAGHGTTIHAFSQVRATDWINEVESLCEKLFKEYTTVDIVGLSLGGLLACHLSQKFPVHHLYLLAPALKLTPKLNWMLRAAPFLQRLGMKYVKNHAGNLCTSQHSELGYRKLPLSAITEIYTLIHSFNFTQPACPIDIFLGKYDKVVDSDALLNQFNHLTNTNLHWLNESAHLLTLDNNVNEIIACLNAP